MLGKRVPSPLIVDCNGPNMEVRDGENDSNIFGSYRLRLLVMEQETIMQNPSFDDLPDATSREVLSQSDT